MKLPGKSQKEKDLKKALGKRIAELRKEKGFSQSELSYDAEIDLSTLSRLERGNLNVTIDTLFKISIVLQVPIQKFFSE